MGDGISSRQLMCGKRKRGIRTGVCSYGLLAVGVCGKVFQRNFVVSTIIVVYRQVERQYSERRWTVRYQYDIAIPQCIYSHR